MDLELVLHFSNTQNGQNVNIFELSSSHGKTSQDAFRNEDCVQLLLHLYIYAPPTLVSTILSDTGSEWNPGQGKSFESETSFM